MSRFKKTAQTADPFASAEVAGSKSGQKRFLQARATGVLRAPNCDLTKLPAELTQAAGNDGEEKWWELKPLTILELQNNLFSELPSLPFPELLVLDLGSNKLTALPNELFDHLKLLKKLNLSQNQLVTLPDSLGTLTQLQELSVTHNKLQSLPASLGSSLGLTSIALDSNQLTELPSYLGAMKLTSLTASGNMLRTLPETLPSSLQSLELKNNQLQSIPSLSRLSQLRRLDLSFNQLSALPDLPTSELVEIFLGNNKLTQVDSLPRCSQLVTVTLNDNKLTVLGGEWGSLEKLVFLDLANNDLSTIPNSLGGLAKLSKIALEGNPLRTIPMRKRTEGIEVLKSYLRSRMAPEESENKSSDALFLALRDGANQKTLSLAKLGLAELPPLDKFGQVEVLDVSGNKLDSLPGQIGTLGSLKRFVGDLNQFVEFPRPLLHLQLQELSLCNNGLRTLPSLRPLAASLYRLDLRRNKLNGFPETILELTNLTHLLLGFNVIPVVPSLSSLSLLQELDLSSVGCRELCDGLRFLPRLGLLNIENNELERIPQELGLCPALKGLLLGGNPQRLIKQPIIAKGTDHVLKYLRDSIPPDSPLLADAPQQQPQEAGTDNKSPEVARLEGLVAALTTQMDDTSLSASKRYALKKDLAMHKAALIKLNRKT